MKRFLVATHRTFKEGEEPTVEGREVIAEHFTIETSGAATFWKQIVPGQSSALIVAFAPREWLTIELISQVDT